MRISLLAAAVLALVAAAAATSVSETTELQEVEPFSNAQRGIDSAKAFVDLLKAGADLFEKASTGNVIGVISGVIGFIGSIFGFFDRAESAELQFMRQEFEKVHAQLGRIELQIGNLKSLIKWTSTMAQYSRHEQAINLCSQKLGRYISATRAQKAGRQREFVNDCRSRATAAEKLYLGIVTPGGSTTTNIILASRRYTGSDQPRTIRFLLSLARIITRGAQVEIAITRLTNRANANAKLQDWNNFTRRLITTIHAADRDMRREAVWLPWMRKDMGDIITELRGNGNNKNFAEVAYRRLAAKYPFRFWFLVVYKAVSGGEHHWARICSGFSQFRAPGGRNVVVASSGKGSRFNRNRANQILRGVNTQVNRQNAEEYVKAIIRLNGNDGCNNSAARIAVAAGNDVWHIGIQSRFAYLLATSPQNARGGRCNNCRMHTFMFG